MISKASDWLLILGIWIIAIAQMWVTLGNREIAKVNQTYNRATNCFAATSPAKRTSQYTKECYDKAEAATSTHIERYGQ